MVVMSWRFKTLDEYVPRSSRKNKSLLRGRDYALAKKSANGIYFTIKIKTVETYNPESFPSQLKWYSTEQWDLTRRYRTANEHQLPSFQGESKFEIRKSVFQAITGGPDRPTRDRKTENNGITTMRQRRRSRRRTRRTRDRQVGKAIGRALKVADERTDSKRSIARTERLTAGTDGGTGDRAMIDFWKSWNTTNFAAFASSVHVIRVSVALRVIRIFFVLD
jgi:hypothetical protein